MNHTQSFAGVRCHGVHAAAAFMLGLSALAPAHAGTDCRQEQTVAAAAPEQAEQFLEWAAAEHLAAVATSDERYCWTALGAPEQGGWDQFLEPIQVCTRTAASRGKKLT